MSIFTDRILGFVTFVSKIFVKYSGFYTVLIFLLPTQSCFNYFFVSFIRTIICLVL